MKKIVLKDIANHVGVSTALVSYVLNGQAEAKQVNKDTAQMILDAAAELKYYPNQIAKSLKTQKTHTIGLIVADINYKFSTGITKSIVAEAKKHKYTVIFGSTNEDKETFGELLNVFINRQVDGLIVVPVENAQDQIKLLQNSTIPFLLIDRYFPEVKANYIALNNYLAAYQATQYLLKSGHKKIAFVNYKSTFHHLQERNRGYLDALKHSDIEFNPKWLQEVSSNSRANDTKNSIQAIMNSDDPCDAVFFATDTLATTGLKYLNDIGVNIPRQLSVFSFDGSDSFELFYCKITHTMQPLQEMGQMAVKTLMELFEDNEVVKQISLTATLSAGTSCRE